MGLLDLFKRNLPPQKTDNVNNRNSYDPKTKKDYSSQAYADGSSIDIDERPYYKPDSYYTYYSYPGSLMAKEVVTFEDRKKISYPTARGLYVGEVMLLEYCSYGKYPKPSSGYPGFWWFQYGIRDIGHALASLENRGFIKWESTEKSLNNLKVSELRTILEVARIPAKGKKAELIQNILDNIPEANSIIPATARKYELTVLGTRELADNGYIPYMHRHRHGTIENENSNRTFNVWVINKYFPDGNAINWRQIVGEIEEKMFGVNVASSVPIGESKLPILQNDCSSQKEDMRQYIESKQSEIYHGIQTPGNGYDEESQGIDYKLIGKDKEAVIKFFIAIGKRFNAPALYTETIALLMKYGLYEEVITVIDAEIENVSMTEEIESALLKKKETIQALL